MPYWLILFLSLALTRLLGQTEPQPSTESACSATDFRCLSDKRVKLDVQLLENERKLDTTSAELGKINDAKAAIAYYQGETKTNPTAGSEVASWKGLLDSYRPEGQVRDEVTKLTELVSKEQQELAKVESAIGSALDVERPKQTFKAELSVAFSLLVGFVIGGFYWIVAKNPDVGKSIFVGDAGLQFITLFSLVIAIILFGLTEVLQGRELAALLGGISGYILGRSGHSNSQPSVKTSQGGDKSAGAVEGQGAGEGEGQGAPDQQH
jgi:hypothetical protein